jgi:hypothetical protein
MATVGCSNSPRMGQALNSKTESVTFSGLYPQSGVELMFTAWNRKTGGFDQFGAAVTTTNSFTDAKGQVWFMYSSALKLPQDEQKYWMPEPDNSMRIDVRTTVRGTTTSLLTFDTTADACLNANLATLSGADLGNTCKSVSSPDANLILPPGKEGGMCTKQSTCEAGLMCYGSPFTTGYRCHKASDVLVGDTTCAWGSNTCNRPVAGIAAQLAQLRSNPNKLNITGMHYPDPNGGYYAPRLDSECTTLGFGTGYEHIQSVARLVNNGNNWFVYGHSTCSGDSNERAGLMFAKISQFPNTNGFGFNQDALSSSADCSGKTPDTCAHNRNWTRFRFSGQGRVGNGNATGTTWSPLPDVPIDMAIETNHPNGMQAVGNLIAVTTWCQPHGNFGWCNNSGNQINFAVIDASNPLAPKTLNRLNLHDPPFNLDGGTSVGMVRLANGTYLVQAVEATSIFFVSDTPYIDSFTQWLRIPGSVNWNSAQFGTLDMENSNLLTDSDGSIWSVGITPGTTVSGDPTHYITAFKLVSDGKGGITYVDGQGVRVILNAGLAGSGAGAGLYVDRSGALRMYGTSYYQSAGTVWITEH